MVVLEHSNPRAHAQSSAVRRDAHHSPSCRSSFQRSENIPVLLVQAAAARYPRRSAQSHAPKAAKNTTAGMLAQMGISTPPAVTCTWKTIRSTCRRAISQRMTKETNDAGFFIFFPFSGYVRLTPGCPQSIDATVRLNTSDGFIQFNVCRGRLFSFLATALR